MQFNVLLLGKDTKQTEVYATLIRDMVECHIDVMSRVENAVNWIIRVRYHLVVIDLPNPSALVERIIFAVLSIVGAMVVSPTILRPNQRVRMSLPDTNRPVRFSGGVAWASFEMPKGGPRYRAGIEFFDADPVALNRFIESNKK